ncbi:aspartate aminotransferase, cytoplasmic-like [Arapaima gigas]
MSADPTLAANYPPVLGLPEFSRRAAELILGRESSALVHNRVLGVQTPGCRAAIRLGAELLRSCYRGSAGWCGPVFLPSPFHDSLAPVFHAAGLRDLRSYRCWEAGRWEESEQQLLEDLEAAPEQAVVLLSATGQCPVTPDLSQDFWKRLTQLMERRHHFPFFLMLEQGLCRGDPELDAWPVRHCVSAGLELLCAQSFSHSFGLYGERVGHLLLVLRHSALVLPLQSQAEEAVRRLWSRPVALGARVVAAVLGNLANRAERDGVRNVAERGAALRQQLQEKLRLLGAPGCWDHLTQQGGLYCHTGLTAEQVGFLAKKRHIYLLPTGRLNTTAMNSNNLDYVAESIYLVLTSSF